MDIEIISNVLLTENPIRGNVVAKQGSEMKTFCYANHGINGGFRVHPIKPNGKADLEHWHSFRFGNNDDLHRAVKHCWQY